MNRTLKSISLIIIVFLLMVAIPSFLGSYDLFDKKANAEDAGWSETTTEGSSGGGTATDPPSSFLVVEIVPYKGMGEIGYLVDGEEPVDEELMNKNSAVGDLSFLGGAITPYDSYVEKPLPASGNADSGWIPIKTIYTQNGYFEYVGTTGGTYQKVTGQEVYTRVADGQGSYKAKLGTENTSIYSESWGQTNDKNVNAYFVYGKPSGVSLYSTKNGYEPCSVTRNANHTGDYDYNSATKTFYLNKGKGRYDVLFSRSSSSSNLYYMLSDYQIVEDNTGKYSWSLIYNYVGATGGNYIKEANGMTFNYQLNNEWNYRYKWIQSDEALNKPSNFYQEGTPETIGEKIWVKGQKFTKTIEYNFNVTLVNNEWFKRLSLGIKPEDCEGYKVDVVTMTPGELNLPENQHYLQEANLFYVNDNYNHNQSYINLYEAKSYEGLALPASSKFKNIKSTLNFGIQDLNWSSTIKVFNRVTGVNADGSLGGYRAAIIFDDTFFQNAVAGNGGYKDYNENVSVSFSWNSKGATVCNLAKLYIMLYQRDPVKFYKAFLASNAPRKITEVASSRNSTSTTGSFLRLDSTASSTSIEATFWNGNTFCAYVQDSNGNLVPLNINNSADRAIIEKEIPNFNITAQTTDMIANVLVLNGQDIFTSKFVDPLGNMPADALEDAQIYMASINGGTVPSTISISSYINVSTASGTGYGGSSGSGSGTDGEDGSSGSNLRTYTSVLNIEPTADFAASEANIRTMLDGYNLVIVNMTSEEFNSNILDINTHFDMIYIGTANGRFNLVNSSTVFNKAEDVAGVLDDNLNGSVYNKGDRMLTSEGTKNYTGNDLTTQKIADLKEFLDAGYPIVLENSLYNLSTTVHKSTNLYSFIQTTKGTAPSSNLMNYADYSSSKVAFMGKLMYSMKIVRPQIRMVQPVLDSASTVNYLYVDPVTKILNIEFALVPNGLVADRSIKYNAYLYVDKNEDGIFSESERINPIPSDGSSSYGITESKFKTYLYSYDMANYNGVYQWQVKVVRQSTDSNGNTHDTPIRSEITRYAAATNKQTIRVLQIMDNPATDSTAYSLENKVNDSSSLLRKYGGFGTDKLEDYDIIFDTMSVAEFLQLCRTEPYTPATAASTNKLAGYHVIILDNQADKITDTYGALTNIKNEITSGIGVIFTRGAINYNNQTDYLTFDNLLFENQKTYPRLCYYGTPTADNHNGNYNDDDPYYIFDFITSGFTNLMNVESTYHTNFITKSNEGADSQYPYKIGAAIKIADISYNEDVTVDYNKNASIPLIGWYSLSDSRSPVVRSQGLVSDTTANTYTGIYSSSPNDVKNNYYLFNRGKTYYSGIQLKAADTVNNDEEIKLFINTIIASYKTSGRIISIAPVITMKAPTPINGKITLSPAEVGSNTQVPVKFEITNSSSHMKLSVLWDDLALTTDNWNTKIYKLSSTGDQTLVTDLTIIDNGTYVVNIPVTDLEGSHKLTLIAENKEGTITKLDTTVEYSSLPITVTIDNADLVKNVDKGEQYLYIDIDYAMIDQETAYLNNSDPIWLEFTVTNASDNVSILLTDAGGNSIAATDHLIHKVGDVKTYDLDEESVPNGSYYVYLPAAVLSGISSQDVTITAKINNTHSGFATVKLLRRSLFQLD